MPQCSEGCTTRKNSSQQMERFLFNVLGLKEMQLMLRLLIILICTRRYEAEDYLIILTSTVDLEAGTIYARAGKMEIIIFGSRDSNKADVRLEK